MFHIDAFSCSMSDINVFLYFFIEFLLFGSDIHHININVYVIPYYTIKKYVYNHESKDIYMIIHICIERVEYVMEFSLVFFFCSVYLLCSI